MPEELFMDEETKSILRAQNDKIDKLVDKTGKIFDMLARVEDRQIKTAGAVLDIKDAQPVVKEEQK